jgi:hypothetical protein
MPDRIFGGRNPAAIVATAAVAVTARIIEIEFAACLGDTDDLRGIHFGAQTLRLPAGSFETRFTSHLAMLQLIRALRVRGRRATACSEIAGKL